MDMFARLVSRLEIRASAERFAVVKAYNVISIARLGWYFPAQLVLRNLASFCYQQSSFLSRIHFNTPFHVSTSSIYYRVLTFQYPWYIILVNTIRRYSWEILVRKLGKYQLLNTDAGVGMSGILAIQTSDHEYAHIAKARIGTNHINFVGES